MFEAARELDLKALMRNLTNNRKTTKKCLGSTFISQNTFLAEHPTRNITQRAADQNKPTAYN